MMWRPLPWLMALSLLLVGMDNDASQTPLKAPFPLKPVPTEQSASHEGVECPPPVAPVRDVMGVSFYTDTHHSIADPRRVEANKTLLQPMATFLRVVSKMTDQHLRSGAPKAAQCALSWLNHWAQADAMLGQVNRQGAYERKWTLGGLALSYVKIAHGHELDRDTQHRVERWFRRLATKVRSEYQHRQRSDHYNNHAYWAGMAVAAVAIATQDRALFEWGLDQYRLGVSQICDDGTLRLELDRKGRALHYHLFALAPLVMLAEMAERNGIPLYRERQGRLHRLVDRVVQGGSNPAAFEQLAGVAQTDPMPPQGGSDLAWVEIWLAKSANPELTRWVVDRRPVIDPRMGGNLTFLYAPEWHPPR